MTRRPALILLIAAGFLVAASPAAQGAFPGANGKIAFECAAPDGRTGICTANPDGTALTLTVDGWPDGARDPAWSADGRRLAFAQGDGWIATALADGSERMQRVVQGSDPTWTPDGHLSYIDTDGEGNLWVANADGTGRRQLTSDALRGGRHAEGNVAEWTDVAYGPPAWSPDGGRVALLRNVQSCRRDYDAISCGALESQYLAMASDGTGRTKLADSSTGGPSGLYSTFGPPSWFPDGGGLVLSVLDNASEQYALELHRVRADGTGQRPIGIKGGTPAVSPDGRRVAYIGEGVDYMAERELATACIEGRNPRRIFVSGPGQPDWQPVEAQLGRGGDEQCPKPPAAISRRAAVVCRQAACRLRLKGSLGPSEGGRACDGRIVAAVYVGGRRVARLRTPVTPDCAFRGQLRWRERPNRTSTLRLRYTGGALFAPTRARPLRLSDRRRSG